ncbi:hypothetical protein DXG01_007592 [Tephrocybe rancida]|nr:hypothetical protein DXG01_007592 [Tephrocybe rancida]
MSFILAPDDKLKDILTSYYNLGMSDKKIVEHCLDHFDKDIYGLSVKTVKRRRKKWGLLSTRQQRHTQEELMNLITEVRQLYPLRGAETIRKQLRIEGNVRISRHMISNTLQIMEPAAVRHRRAHRFHQKKFYAAGPNDVWVQDQHDKWGPRFGLWLHNNIDPFTGFNNWMKVWWTNSNPRLVGRFYIEAVRELGAVPVLTQSDPGSENYGVANIHTRIRHEMDPLLQDTLQHVFKRKHNNVKSEANWSVFRHDFAPGYEDLFQHGVDQGWYDVDNLLENLIFRWLAIPWLQVKLNEWVYLRNHTAPRANKHKVLPHGIPVIIREKPDKFHTYDFKIPVSMELLDRLELEYAPPNHPVFQLTPPAFDQHANELYNTLNRPQLSSRTFWHTYRQLREAFLTPQVIIPSLEPINNPLSNIDQAFDFTSIALENQTVLDNVEQDSTSFALLPGLKQMRQGCGRVGQNGGEASELNELEFTSESEDENGVEQEDSDMGE